MSGLMQGVNDDGEEIRSMFVRKAADYGLDFGDEPSLTRTEFAEDLDINNIMSRFERTGELPANVLQARPPQYLDLSDVPADYHVAMNAIRAAELAFMQLPAAVRLEFENDLGRFVEFAEDPENIDQMRAWGLAKPAERPPEPVKVEVVSDGTSVGGASGGASESQAKP